MGKFTVTHEINCNAETFWKVFFEKEFNERCSDNEARAAKLTQKTQSVPR